MAFNRPPDADPVANKIAELAAAGKAVGIIASATDPDAGSTVTYSLNDSHFASVRKPSRSTRWFGGLDLLD